MEIYTSGATNFFRYPELSDSAKASELISTFEEKKPLAELMLPDSAETEEGDGGIKVYIGQEAPLETMKDCAVVTASYDMGDGMYGKIGIVGPKRMDYDKVVSTLKKVRRQLDEIYKNDD